MGLLEERLSLYGEMVDRAIISYLPDDNCLQQHVMQAMKYSITAGGKRIRPVLVLEFCRQCGGDPQAALAFASAHSASLFSSRESISFAEPVSTFTFQPVRSSNSLITGFHSSGSCAVNTDRS